MRVSLESLFGELEQQQTKRPGVPCKPNPEVYNVIGPESPRLYVGNNLTDMQFVQRASGMLEQSIWGIIVTDSDSNSFDRWEMEKTVLMATPRDVAYENICMFADMLIDEYGDIEVDFDLDDTLHPKFSRAQELAAVDLGSEIFNGLGASNMDFLTHFAQHSARDARGGQIAGSDRKLALALLFLLQGHDPQHLSPNYLCKRQVETQTDQEHLDLLRQYIRGPSEDESDLVKAINERVESRPFVYDPLIGVYSPRFREIEGAHSKVQVERGDTHLYQEIYEALTALTDRKRVKRVGIITNKPEVTLRQFYSTPFAIR